MPADPETFRLYLLRHAQAAWPQPGETDIARALDNTGRKQAERIAEAMDAHDWRPERVVCSPALRCRQTVAPLERVSGQVSPTVILPELYDGEATVYIEVIASRAADGLGSILLVGHNPTIEHVFRMAIGDAQADRVMEGGYDPATLGVIDLERTALGQRRLQGTLRHYLQTR